MVARSFSLSHSHYGLGFQYLFIYLFTSVCCVKDAELCAMMEEEEVNEDPPSPSEEVNDERALALYHHPTNANTPFVKSPTSTDFSIIVKADLIPGLKGNHSIHSFLFPFPLLIFWV